MQLPCPGPGRAINPMLKLMAPSTPLAWSFEQAVDSTVTLPSKRFTNGLISSSSSTRASHGFWFLPFNFLRACQVVDGAHPLPRDSAEILPEGHYIILDEGK